MIVTASKETGFSLIELIVVLVILGLLAGIVGPRAFKGLAEGKQKVAKIQISEIEGALEKFCFDNGRYPDSSEGLEALLQNLGNLTSWKGPYLKKPQLPLDPWGKSYIYRCPGQHGDYDLLSFGANGMEGGEGENDDVVSWKQ